VLSCLLSASIRPIFFGAAAEVTPVLVRRSTVSAARVVQPVGVSQVRLATPAVTQ
jgi:hypothetical protein